MCCNERNFLSKNQLKFFKGTELMVAKQTQTDSNERKCRSRQGRNECRNQKKRSQSMQVWSPRDRNKDANIFDSGSVIEIHGCLPAGWA
jgi:hypothetical protein